MNTKRVPIDLNLAEIKHLLSALSVLNPNHNNNLKLHNRLEDVLSDQVEIMEQDEIDSKMFTEDEDGYQNYTEEAREGLSERYSREEEKD